MDTIWLWTGSVSLEDWRCLFCRNYSPTKTPYWTLHKSIWHTNNLDQFLPYISSCTFLVQIHISWTCRYPPKGGCILSSKVMYVPPTIHILHNQSTHPTSYSTPSEKHTKRENTLYNICQEYARPQWVITKQATKMWCCFLPCALQVLGFNPRCITFSSTWNGWNQCNGRPTSRVRR